MSRDLRSSPISEAFGGSYRPPGDKSISHRLAILSGLAQGRSYIGGFLDSADTLKTADAMAALGATIERVKDDFGWSLQIDGGKLKPPTDVLDFGNSGTGFRLMAGLLSAMGTVPAFQGARIGLVGDDSLSKRPMRRIIDPLTRQGAMIESDDGHAPIWITPQTLKGQRHDLPIASAQVKSALLLAGLHAQGETRIIEPEPSRDHTERLLAAFGADWTRHGPKDISIRGGQRLVPGRHQVPGDISSAAFLVAASLMSPSGALAIERVGLNPTRDGFLRICQAMGAQLKTHVTDAIGEEPVGVIEAGSAQLKGVSIDEAWVPLAIDEFPIVMAMASVAQGVTEISGAQELRVKESDRLAQMCTQLKRLGVNVVEKPDGAVITGGTVNGGVVDCAGDHRIAMSFAVLGLVAKGPIIIEQAHWMETSYPDFVADMNRLGAQLEWLG